jgi:hypothetical protein
MMEIEAEVRDIKLHVIEISKKIDELMYERDIVSMMKFSEKSLSGFFEDEPDIYKNPFASKSIYKTFKKSLIHDFRSFGL